MTILGYKAFFIDRDKKLFTAPRDLDERYYFDVGEDYYIDNIFKIEICSRGYHFCQKLTDVFNNYPFLRSIAYCQVEGIYYKSNDCIVKENKIATRGIRIIKVLTWDEVLSQIKRELKANSLKSKNRIKSYFNLKADNLVHSYYVSDSTNIFYSDSVDTCKNISTSDNIFKSFNIENSKAIFQCRNVSESKKVFCSNFVENSDTIIHSDNIQNSNDVLYSSNIINSYNVAYSKNIKNSFYIIHTTNIDASDYIFNCINLSDCLFCDSIVNKSNHLFNKHSSNKRITEVKYALKNILDRKYNFYFIELSKALKNTRLDLISLFDYDKQFDINCLKDFPQEAIEYLKSLPEFNAEIFERITNIKVENA